MRKFLFILLLTLFLFSTNNLYAEINPRLVNALNNVLKLEIKSIEQCEKNSDALNISIPYHQIIMEKHTLIKDLADLIDDIGGTLDKNRYTLSGLQNAPVALNEDAGLQIEILQKYDDILQNFGHPRVQKLVKQAKTQTLVHFMLLTNKAQQFSSR